MSRLSLFFCFSLFFAVSVRADELTKSVQGALKEQGFFYGEVTGASGPETAAAVKRYQIRNGLEVTGTLTKETLEALGLADGGPISIQAPPSNNAPIERAPEPVRPLEPPPPPKAIPAPAPRSPVDLRRESTAQESDREFLRREEVAPSVEDDPPFQRTPSRAPVGPYARTFSQTPYASAPLEVQRDVIRRAQRFLENLDFYEEDIDGVPGPALEEGIARYQRFIALPLTGHLDMETLAAMRLLPGRGGAPSQSANPQVRRVPGQPLRGVWIK